MNFNFFRESLRENPGKIFRQSVERTICCCFIESIASLGHLNDMSLEWKTEFHHLPSEKTGFLNYFASFSAAKSFGLPNFLGWVNYNLELLFIDDESPLHHGYHLKGRQCV